MRLRHGPRLPHAFPAPLPLRGDRERRDAVPPAPTSGPTWSPDGREIAYDAAGYALFRIEVDGCRALTQLTNTSRLDRQPAWQWSPDTRAPTPAPSPCPASSPAPTPTLRPSDRVLFTSLRDGNHEIYVMNGDGTGQTNLTNNPAEDASPVWSPDGTKIAFTSNRASAANTGGRSNIYVMDADGSNVRKVTRNDEGIGARVYDPAWSPDGSAVAFTSYRDQQQRDIYLVSADGGTPARLTTHPADDFDADWRAAQAPPRPAAESTIQLRWNSFRVREVGPGDTVTVTRLGELSREVTVDLATSDTCPPTAPCHRTARDRSDYVRAAGTLRFGPGEASRTINITVIDDTLIEGDEGFILTLSNAAGATLGGQSQAGVIITDNDTNPAAQNPIDTPHFLVRMHYLDFLGREPEPAGLQAWVGVLNRCPNVFNLAADDPSAECDRIKVSSSFFLSPESSFKGIFAFMFYRVSLGRSPTYAEFVRDLQSISGQTADEVIARKAEFTVAWAERAEFKSLYVDHAAPEAFVDRLLQVAGLTLGGQVTRDSLVEDLRAGRKTRADVVRAVAEHPDARAKEFNAAFVTMQYFGYLKRDPEEAGFNAWLKYLNANPADFRTMIHGFLNSHEYRSRFGRP